MLHQTNTNANGVPPLNIGSRYSIEFVELTVHTSQNTAFPQLKFLFVKKTLSFNWYVENYTKMNGVRFN